MPVHPQRLEPAPLEELFRRVDDDRGRLSHAFARGRPLGPVTEVLPVGDPHDGRRRVTLVRFGRGTRVVYKPRPVATDLFWHGLAIWVNRRAGQPWLAAPEVLDCGAYGWARYLRPGLPRGHAAARKFHRRAGFLLAMLDALEVRDAHVENVIAWQGYPVLVDPESIVHPRFPPFTGSPSLALTGFLPAPGEVDRRAGILAGQGRGRPLGPAFAHDVLAGYRTGYHLLRRHRAQLVTPRGPLADLSRLQSRVLIRPSSRYADALGGKRWPPAGTTRLPFPPEVSRAIVGYERRAIAMGDLPVFRARAGSRVLEPGGPCLSLSGAGAVRRRLARLGRQDCERMLAIIRGALALDRAAAAWGEPPRLTAQPGVRASLGR